MRKIIFILLLTFHAIAFAAELKPTFFIFHINGVNTTRDDAFDNLDKIRKVAKIDSNVINWDYVYNPTHGLFVSDLWDAIRQKRQENQNLTIDDYVRVYMKSHNLSYVVGSKEYNDLKDHIKDSYAKDIEYVGYNFDTILGQFNSKTNWLTQSVVDLFKSRQNRGKTVVLLLPHSQGCLYANSLRNFLIGSESFPKENIGIFAIANPADKIDSDILPAPEYIVGGNIPSGQQYITADNDSVINALRVFSFFSPYSNQPMPATIHLKTCNDSNLCHNLVDAYLADPASATAISKKINLFVIALEKKLLDTQISLELVFGNYSDHVDLTDSNKKIICHGKQCDENLFGHILLDPEYFQGRELRFQSFLFSFPDKISPGKYFVLQGPQEESDNYINIWSNGLLAQTHYLTGGCRDEPITPGLCNIMELKMELADPFSCVFYTFKFDIVPEICNLYNNYCSNNSLMKGEFVLGAPRPTEIPAFKFSQSAYDHSRLS